MHSAQDGEQTRAGRLQGGKRLLMEHSPHSHLPTFPHPTCKAEKGWERRGNTQISNWGVEFCCAQIMVTTPHLFFLKIQTLQESYKYCTVPTPQCCSHIHTDTSGTHPRVRVTHPWHTWTVNHIYQYRNHLSAQPTPLMHYPISQKHPALKIPPLTHNPII